MKGVKAYPSAEEMAATGWSHKQKRVTYSRQGASTCTGTEKEELSTSRLLKTVFRKYRCSE